MKRGYKEITNIMGFGSENTYYSWKKEKRPIINLLEKYFTKEELSEFLTSGEIQKLHRIEELLEIEKKYNQIKNITKGAEHEEK